MKTRFFFLMLSFLISLSACKTLNIQKNPSITEQNKDGTARFQAISVVNEQVVWTSGTQGTFARTINGGASWELGKVPNAQTLEFRDVHAFDAQNALLMSAGDGEKSRIYQTNDGGKTWTLTHTNAEPKGFYDCMDFWDRQRGLLFSDSIDGKLVIMKTDDSGKTWTRIPATNLPDALPNEGAFAASGTCVEAQPNGFAAIGTGATSVKARFLYTTDFGQTWKVSASPIISNSPTAGITSVVMQNTQKGFLFGGDFTKDDPPAERVARTEDGGKTWTLGNNPPLRNGIFGAATIPKTPLFIVVGPKGANYSTDAAQSWKSLHNGDFWSVGCATSSCWLVGAKSNIVKVSWN